MQRMVNLMYAFSSYIEFILCVCEKRPIEVFLLSVFFCMIAVLFCYFYEKQRDFTKSVIKHSMDSTKS